MTFVPLRRYFNPTVEISVAGTVARFHDGAGLTMRFRVQRSLSATPDTAQAEIVGLDPVRAKAMGATFRTIGAAVLTIRAGYDGIVAGVFTGDVREFADQIRQGPNLTTLVTADDGGDAISEVPLRISNAGMTASEMVRVAAVALKLVIHPSANEVIAASDPGKQGPYAAVMTGKAADLLDAAARRIRARWWVKDGQIFMGRRGAVSVRRPAVTITRDNLIATPVIQGSGAATFPVLFDPNLIPGSQVVHEAQHYRIEALTHEAQTRGGLLTSTVQGRSL